jgi:hypothetical protein
MLVSARYSSSGIRLLIGVRDSNQIVSRRMSTQQTITAGQSGEFFS